MPTIEDSENERLLEAEEGDIELGQINHYEGGAEADHGLKSNEVGLPTIYERLNQLTKPGI